MHPSRDAAEIQPLIDRNAPEGFMCGMSAGDWLTDPRHFALIDGDDLALFEASDEWPGPLCAHVLFASRGKHAYEVARAMLAQAFAFGATKILGETPAHFRHALLFVRRLGFRPYGEGVNGGSRVILSALEQQPI